MASVAQFLLDAGLDLDMVVADYVAPVGDPRTVRIDIVICVRSHGLRLGARRHKQGGANDKR
jgi:hypothetical protein